MKNIKTIGFILMLAVILSLVVVNSCQRRKLVEKTKEITTINVHNKFIEAQNKDYAESLKNEIKKRETLQQASAGYIAENKKLTAENKRLKENQANIPGSVNDLPIDSSYNFVNLVAYPFLGDRHYPFNDLQVRGIHISYLENLNYNKLLTVTNSQLENCENRVFNTEALAESFKNSLDICEKQNLNDGMIIKNLQDISVIQEKDLKRSKNKLTFWKTTTFIGIAGVIILLL